MDPSRPLPGRIQRSGHNNDGAAGDMGAQVRGAVQWESVEDTVLTISRIPYGRPSELTTRGVLNEWRGTCSTKHLLLAEVVHERWPACRPQLVHRVYRVTRDFAAMTWGDGVAAAVPERGLIDVHTYATLVVGGSE